MVSEVSRVRTRERVYGWRAGPLEKLSRVEGSPNQRLTKRVEPISTRVIGSCIWYMYNFPADSCFVSKLYKSLILDL